MEIVKKGFIKVPTQPKDFDLQATGLVFKSYDNQIALEFNVVQQDGKPADLLGANLRLLMFIYDEVDGIIKKEPIPFITKSLITESFLNGHVVYILPEAMKAYNGMVEAYVYIEYPDGSTSDNLGFTFRMKRSAIDGLAQDKADYFIADFQQLLDGVKREATDAVNAALTNVDSTIEKANQQINEFVEGATQAIDQTVDEVTEQLQDAQTKVEAVSKNVSSAQNDLTILEDRIDQTNQQIGDLGKLKKMYSNSIDFGGYDYSGNPNLFVNKLESSDFIKGNHGSLTDDNGILHFTSDGTGDIGMLTSSNMPSIGSGKTYTLSAKLRFDEGTTGDINKLRLVYRKTPGGSVLLEANNTSMIIDDVGKEITIKGTANVAYEITNLDRFYIGVSFSQNGKINGGFKLYDIKIEAGSTATPYQPNLLDAPYYLSKTPLGENIANKDIQLPIKTSRNQIYMGDMEEPFIIGETYTLTMKATKPSTQSFRVYNYGMIEYGDMTPVEGLTDVWQSTFTVSKIHEPYPSSLTIYQQPKETVGACQIDWLKIEKGDTRTPNIERHRYKGLALLGTTEPTKYEWGLSLQGEEEDLNVAKAYTDERVQTITNTANSYTDAAKTEAINSANEYANARKAEAVSEANAQAQNKVTALEDKLTAISHLELNITNGNTGSCHLYRQGKIVTLYFQNLCGKSSGGADSKIADLPEGSFPPVTFEQLVGSTDRSTLNSAAIEIASSGAIYWKRNTSFGSGYTFIVTYVLG